MLFFGKKKNINSGVEECKRTKGAILLDVREVDEYKSGHIPGAINVPLSTLNTRISEVVPEKDRPVFVHCLSGARSGKAVGLLKSMGYSQVENIGGINAYKGIIEK